MCYVLTKYELPLLVHLTWSVEIKVHKYMLVPTFDWAFMAVFACLLGSLYLFAFNLY